MRLTLLALVICLIGFSNSQLFAQPPVIISIDTASLDCQATGSFSIPIRVKNFTNVGSFQFSIQFDNTKLSNLKVGKLHLPFSIGNPDVQFDTTNFIGNGQFTMTFTQFGGLTVPDDSVVLDLTFNYLGGGFASVAIIESGPAPAGFEVTDPNGNPVLSDAVPGGFTPDDTENPVISCPANVLLESNSPVTVSNIPATFSDNCGTPTVGWTSSGTTTFNFPNDPDASGANFNPGGVSTVIYSATDVGGNVATCSFSINIETIGTDTLTVILDKLTLNCNDASAIIPVSSLHFDSIGSLQFSVFWDKNLLKFDSVSGFQPQLGLDNTNNFNTLFTLSDGRLGFQWTSADLYGTTLVPFNNVLFEIYFTVLGSIGSMAALQFGGTPIVQEGYSSATLPAEEVPVKYLPGSVKITDATAPKITCPPSTTVSTQIGQNSVNVNGLTATATDDCDATPTLTFVRSGATLGSGTGSADGIYFVGKTDITFTATDDSGNKSICTMSVIVNQTTLDTVTFAIDTLDNLCFKIGDTIEIPLRVYNFQEIFGAQFNVAWDENQLSLLGLTNIFPGMTPQNGLPGLVWADTSNGLFKYFSASPSWPDIPDGGVFFNLKFRVEKYPASVTLLMLPNDVVNSSFQSVPVAGINGFYKSEDLVPPVVICPANVTANAVTNECSANVLLPVPTISDDCSGLKTLSSSHPSINYSSGITTVIYTVIDNSNNQATCSFTVTVIDAVAPQYFNCPKDTVVYSPFNACEKAVFWKEPNLVDGCGNTTFLVDSANYQSGTAFPVGEIIISYLGTDITNLSATCSFKITVVDSVPPALTCPPPSDTVFVSNGNCDYIFKADTLTAFDACDLFINIMANVANGTLLPIGKNSVTYTATDNYGNKTKCQQDIFVLDANAPKLINCPPSDTVIVTSFDVTLGCGTTATWTQPGVSNICLGANVNITSSHFPGAFFGLGSTEVKYLAQNGTGKDSCSFTILVEDKEFPKFDNSFFPINKVINLPAGKCDTVLHWNAPIGLDLCGVDTVFSNIKSGSKFPLGGHTIIYTVVDESGNSATRSFSITINDVTKPKISNCPPTQTVNAAGNCQAIVTWPTVTATDDCGTVSLLPQNLLSGDTFEVGTHDLQIFAIDESQNIDTCSFKITVIGVGNPDLECPPNQIFTCTAPNVSWLTPVASGFCSAVTLDSTHVFGNFQLGATTVKFTAKDVNNNEATCEFLITVSDNVAPAIVCPGNIEISLGGAEISDPSNFISSAVPNGGCDAVALAFGQPAATDNCTNVIVVQTSGLAAGSAFSESTQTMAYKATDASGNTSTCEFSIKITGLPTLTATVDPAVGCENDMVILSVDSIPGATYTWSGPQQNYPNTSTITIFSLSTGNAGIYTVFAKINGCNTAAISTVVTLVPNPDANDDLGIKIKAGESLANIDVLGNDSIDSADASVTLVAPVNGVTLNSDNTFSFSGTENPGDISFLYQLCSKTCPDKCDMAQVTITIQDTRCLFIPNIITPNGDGINDDFYIPCLDTDEYQNNSIVIYNQWGTKVYEAAPYKNGTVTGWKGTLDGTPGRDLPDGVYYYIFKTSNSGNAEVKKGFIEILR